MTQDQLQILLQQLYHPPAPSNPKVKDPELYYRERPKLQAFITQCELRFNCKPNTFTWDTKKVHYASSQCWGNAWAWIEPCITDGKSKYEGWEDFKTAITRAFGEVDSKEVARRKFKTIWEGNCSATAYWVEFKRIMGDLDYNDPLYIDQFNDGLHLDVQRQLTLLDTRPTTMTDFANKAIDLDNRVFNFHTLWPRNEPQYYREHQYVHPRNLELTTSDLIPMEIDATRKPRGKDCAEEEKRRRNNECYNCGKSGHYSAHCPTKKQTYKRKPYRAAEATAGEMSGEEESGKEDPRELEVNGHSWGRKVTQNHQNPCMSYRVWDPNKETKKLY
jgi:hypothetical protein